MDIRKYPIGIQDFEDIRTGNYVYVDKTAFIYSLVSEGKPYFLSRPRRFGKSLLLSTLKAYFEGKKELFSGLAIAELEKEWLSYPVFHLDFNLGDYRRPGGLDLALDSNLRQLEEIWGENPKDIAFSNRFQGLIRRAAEKAGRKVVVLIDEYDKALLAIDDEKKRDEARDTLRAFYGVLKSADPYLKFYLITGITKFAKVSIFSDLNQLFDISLMEEYASLCGITPTELLDYFTGDIKALAEKNNMTFDQAMAEMQRRYNGYHFAEDTPGVYNPFSVLNTLKKKKFHYYWFETGTPAFLVKTLANIDYNPEKLKSRVTISANSVMDYRFEDTNPVPILYQSGYLTIKSYDPDLEEFTLGFPNGEVEYGFLNELLPAYSPWVKGNREELSVRSLIKDLDAHNIDSFMTRLRALFSGIPYPLTEQSEYHYQSLLYLVFALMGEFAQAEVAGAAGRSDMVIMRRETVYVFEFKLSGNGTAEEALRQIDEKGYLLPYSAEGKRLLKVGVEFDREKRTIGKWLLREG
ncbi:MAG: ATP-binding protein [Spirochaetales bacterium]|jgi:hypothetical protein|nr:ATP-binding protein [Spirochaetales bacterium]